MGEEAKRRRRTTHSQQPERVVPRRSPNTQAHKKLVPFGSSLQAHQVVVCQISVDGNLKGLLHRISLLVVICSTSFFLLGLLRGCGVQRYHRVVSSCPSPSSLLLLGMVVYCNLQLIHLMHNHIKTHRDTLSFSFYNASYPYCGSAVGCLWL